MRTVRWLQAVALLWLVGGAIGGTLLISFRGLVPARFGDCPRPPGSHGPSGCFTMGNPHAWVGGLVLIAAVVGAAILWRVAVNLAAGRTTAGWPRA
jgi:hypothetical protein